MCGSDIHMHSSIMTMRALWVSRSGWKGTLPPIYLTFSLSHTHTHTVFILFFPLLFAFGWLPQADTFVIFLLEQIDIHVFGGTPATGLICGFYALARSILVAAVLWPLGYAAFARLEVGWVGRKEKRGEGVGEEEH